MTKYFNTLSAVLALSTSVGSIGAQIDASRSLEQPSADISLAVTRGDRESARTLLGKNVDSQDGETLGKLTDLAVNPSNGEIVFALISSGGVLGFGAEVRAVPFTAMRNTYDPDGHLVLEIDRGRWPATPPLSDDQIASLGSATVVQPAFEAFGKDVPQALSSTNSTTAPELTRVSEIIGRDVLSGGAEMAEVEDVVVNLQNGRASVLLDPDDGYAGSDQKVIIGFDDITKGEDDMKLATTLTPEQIRSATPSPRDWWATRPGQPYVWNGFETADDSSPQVKGRPTPQLVRGAVRMSPELSENARENVSIEERGGQLVISGTVESRAMKDKVAEVAAAAAEGHWQIENRVNVQNASE